MLLELEQSQQVRLGPARVLKAAGQRVLVELGDEEVWAQMALAYPYQPAPHDVLLTIRQQDDCYVIGVLQGQGVTSLVVPGDLSFQAPRGVIRLSAGHGVEIKSDQVRITANKLELFARSVLERFTVATRWVREAFHLRAGRVRTTVDAEYRLHAGRLVERAEADVKIDGEKIHLG